MADAAARRSATRSRRASAARRRRDPQERQGPDGPRAHRHGRAARRGADRPPLREQGHDEGRLGRDRLRHARLRPRHPHDVAGRRRGAPREGEGPLARNARSSSASRPRRRAAARTKMLKDGLFTRFPKPDFALALHDKRERCRPGKIGVTSGLRPRQRRLRRHHDLRPRRPRRRPAHDRRSRSSSPPAPILALQTIVARENNPFDPAVVTVGSIHGGTKHNIIPDEVKLQLTVRSYKDEVRKQLLDAIARIAKAEAAAAGAPKEPSVAVIEGDARDVQRPGADEARSPARSRAGVRREQRRRGRSRSMGGEDFSEYGRAGVPAAPVRGRRRRRGRSSTPRRRTARRCRRCTPPSSRRTTSRRSRRGVASLTVGGAGAARETVSPADRPPPAPAPILHLRRVPAMGEFLTSGCSAIGGHRRSPSRASSSSLAILAGTWLAARLRAQARGGAAARAHAPRRRRPLHRRARPLLPDLVRRARCSPLNALGINATSLAAFGARARASASASASRTSSRTSSPG